ncbi:MAG: HU family DNA-binding protein [Pseudomonadota bacterium]|nr:HU family DNA-binding protein [Pseudomonadota bacterium]MEA3240360.1 HU family DNA-binding protein [Pseudomonadota bacterium]
MTKAELVEGIAGKAGVSKAASEKVLKAFMEEVKGGIKKGERVTLVGFGTFYAAERPARMGRNPRTGEEIKIPACTVPKFKAGKALKDDLN